MATTFCSFCLSTALIHSLTNHRNSGSRQCISKSSRREHRVEQTLYLHYSEKVQRLKYLIGVSDGKLALEVAEAILSEWRCSGKNLRASYFQLKGNCNKTFT